jgi:hypothetical protein
MDLVRSSLRPEDVYQLVYGAVAMTVVLIGVDEPLRSPYLAAHAAITAVVLLAPPAATIWPVMPLRLVRDLYHLPAGLFYYRETAALHHVVWGDRSFDGLVIGLDQLLFNGQPSLSFARHFPGAGFSAVMHLAYLSYYLLVIAGALALWSCPDAVRVYPRSAHAVAFTMLVCCAMFVAFPVVGPSYYWPDLPFEASPGAAVMRVFDGILALEVPTGAMPSSHVAGDGRAPRRVLASPATGLLGLRDTGGVADCLDRVRAGALRQRRGRGADRGADRPMARRADPGASGATPWARAWRSTAGGVSVTTARGPRLRRGHFSGGRRCACGTGSCAR